MSKFLIEQDGMFQGEEHFAIYQDGRHPNGGHAWIADWLTADEAKWLCDMLNTGADLASRMIEFIKDHPDASWTAIRMGWAMTEGATFEQANRAVGRGAWSTNMDN